MIYKPYSDRETIYLLTKRKVGNKMIIGAIDILGCGVKLASEMGVGTVVAGVCKTYLPETASTATKVCVGVASMGISGAVAAATNDWWDERIGDAKKIVGEIKGTIGKDKTKPEEKEEEVVEVEVEDVEVKVAE